MIKQNLKLLLLSLLFCYFLAEVIFRLKGDFTTYSEKNGGSYQSGYEATSDSWLLTYEPNEEFNNSQKEFTTHFIANNEGLNDKFIRPQKEKYRIIIIGDSFTEGKGAPNDSSYPRILEHQLWANKDSNIQVINAGIAGSDVFFEYKLLQTKLLKYNPYMVLLTINSTDFCDFIYRGGLERFKENGKLKFRSHPWFEPIYANSFTARNIIHKIANYNYMFLKPDEEIKMNDSACKMIIYCIDSFQSLCKKNNIKFGIVFHPMEQEINGYAKNQIGGLIKHCEIRDIPFIDERPFLYENNIDSTNCNKIYWSIDRHFNSSGYKLLAKATYSLVLKLL